MNNRQLIGTVCFLGLMLGGTTLQAEIQPDYLMMSDPSFPTPPPRGKQIDQRLVPLWIEALARPEADLQRQAAGAILEAHRMGFREVDAARPALVQSLGRSTLPYPARWGVARALIGLEAKDAAEALYQAAEKDPRLRDVVEPALAVWDYSACRSGWRQRIQNPDPNRSDLVVALQCVGRVRDAESLEGVLSIVRNREFPADVRLAAARAAGETAESGLEQHAQSLAPHSGAATIDRLCAVAMLVRHTSEEARRNLAAYSIDPEPAVAAQALRTLNSIDFALVLPLAEQAMRNRDGNVRYEGIRCYLALPTPQRIPVVGRQLNDPHPRNRYFVREEFYRLAQQPELDGPVRESITTELAGDDWRGQEQSALLVAALDHKPVAPRLVELLESTRPEVMASTAWALRKLMIPETLPAMLDKVTRQSASPSASREAVDPQLAHLFEAMAMMDYQPVVPLLRTYVPKDITREISRSAAVWALGHLLKSTPDEQLGNQLLERYLDSMSMPPERDLVRRMSAISIGRMKTKGQVAGLRKVVGEFNNGSSEDSAAWAIEQITGETIPPAPLVDEPYTVNGWFLEPVP